MFLHIFRKRSLLISTASSASRAPFAPLPTFRGGKPNPTPVADGIYARMCEFRRKNLKGFEERKKRIREKLEKETKEKDEAVKKNMELKFKEFKEKEKEESPDDAVFKLLVTISSHRVFMKLKKKCEADQAFGENLRRLVTRVQHKSARFLLFAIGEESRYSIPKFYTSESASRAFARFLCPLMLFLAGYVTKTGVSMAWDAHRKSIETVELDEKLVDLEKGMEGEIKKIESKMETTEKKTVLEISKIWKVLSEKEE